MQLYKGLVPAKYAQRVQGSRLSCGRSCSDSSVLVCSRSGGASLSGVQITVPVRAGGKAFPPGIAPVRSVLYHLVAFPDLKLGF